MFYSITGKLSAKREGFMVVETSGIGFKINTIKSSDAKTVLHNDVKFYCYFNHDSFELYGFISEHELELFESLISVSGIGPKMAQKILNSSSVDEIESAIVLQKPDHLSGKGGVSVKTASKIVLELKDKLKKVGNLMDLENLDEKEQIEGMLRSLGYQRKDIQKAISKIPHTTKKIEDRIKFVLKYLAS